MQNVTLIIILASSRRLVASCLAIELLRWAEDTSKVRNRQRFGDRHQTGRNAPKSCQLPQSRRSWYQTFAL